MTLRAFLTLITAVVVVFALATASALVVEASVQHRTSSTLGNSVGSLSAVSRLEIDLLEFSRDSDLALLSGSPQRIAARETAERSLRQEIRDVEQYVDSPDERRAYDRMVEHLESFMKTRQAAERADRDVLQVNRDTTPQLEEALASLEAFADMNRGQAAAARKAVDFWDNAVTLIGFGTAGMLLVAGAVVLFIVRRGLVVPLQRISTAIEAFRSGKRQRVPERGAVELAEIARRFNEMGDALESQREDQLRFVASVAHDLRNPLSALRLSAARLRRTNDASGAESARLGTLIERQTGRLERMVGDLLDSARIESGHLELALLKRDVRELVSETAELFRDTSEGHPLDIQIGDAPLPVSCDPTRIEQVLSNLLSNAIKYSPQGGAVEVVAMRVGAFARISVTDHGIGMSEEDQRSLFQPFRRLGGAHPEIPGTGLGLSVARRIVEAHRGALLVSSRVGEGSTFTVVLPLDKEARATLEPGAPLL